MDDLAGEALAPELVAGWSLASSSANATQAAAALRDLGQRLDDVTWALAAPGASALDVARAAKTSFGADAKACAMSLGTCDYPAEELAKALARVSNDREAACYELPLAPRP